MKHSKILRQAAKLGYYSYLCSGVEDVCIKNNIPKKVYDEVTEKIHTYIKGHITFNKYLNAQTNGSCERHYFDDKRLAQEKFIKFLRYKMAIFLAEQYELEGK